jgi:hypothetical protein
MWNRFSSKWCRLRGNWKKKEKSSLRAVATRHTSDRVPLVLCLLLFAAGPASAQDMFSLFHEGAETKSHAGAGVVFARNAPASYYNPANLIEEKKGFTPYGSLDLLSLNYQYTHPGYDPVEVSVTTPVPFFGFAWRPEETLSDVTLAFSFLPIPSSSNERKIDKLPTRKFAGDSESEPVLMDVTTKGNGVGYRGSLGVSYRIMSGLGIGASVLFSKSGGTTTAKTHGSGEVLIVDRTESSSYGLLLGVRGSVLRGRVNSGLSVRMPSTNRGTGSTRYPALAGDAEAPKKSSSKGPMGIAAGFDALLSERIVPFAEVHYTNWSSIRTQKRDQVFDEAEVDYFNTTDLILGTDLLAAGMRFSLSYGIYQSSIGDGIMKSESEDDRELIGMEFQDVGGLPHNDVGAGCEFLAGTTRIQTGLLYVSGQREVWKKARGYGEYQISIFSLTVSASVLL